MFNNQVIAGSSGQGGSFYDFPIEQSLRFNRADSAKLTRTASSPTLGTKATWSFWVKKCDVSEDTSSSYRTVFYAGTPNVDGFRIGFARYSGNNHVLHISQDNGSSAAYIFMRTDAALRDTSAWYNFVIRYDSTDATAADRIKVYINGELASIQSSPRTNPPLNHIPKWQVSGASLIIGDGYTGYNEAIDMYLAEVNFIDGQALDPTSFGETKSGIWVPVDTSGLSYGTNGFRLNFADTVEASGFNAVTYTGNGGTQSVSGVGFSSSPDFVWIKERSSTSSHILVNSVIGSTKLLSSNTTDAEATDSNKVASLDADGFSLGSSGAVNQSSQTYVAWAWDAGSGSAASNTDGTITSTVKANTDYGFSIVSYTGTGSAATVGHGLTTAPDMIIAKRRNTTGSWGVYHSGMTSATYQMWLNLTNGETSRPAQWNSTAPTSSVFSIGTDTDVNASGSDYIAYCFAEKTGYSSFGTYTGTGAAGNSITGLGFKPAFLLTKRTDTTGNWGMWDNTRNTEGTITKYLIADLANAEGDASSVGVDFDDDGFTFQGGSAVGNGSGGTYIYMAFADTRDAAFWRDVSGQGNDWQHNNLTFSDVVPDSATNNFATFNEIGKAYSDITMAEGNLKATYTNGSGWSLSPATMSMSSGKWYWESTVSQVGGYGEAFGMLDAGDSPINAGRNYNGYRALGYGWAGHDNAIRHNNVSLYSPGTYSANDIICAAYDADTRELWLRVNNGSWIGGGDPATGTSAILTLAEPQGGGYIPSMSGYNSTVGKFNFGQDSTFQGTRAAGGNADENGYGDFQYAVPSGFLSLNSSNLPSGAIDTLNDETPEDYFNTALYTGNGGTQSITGLNFQPSLTWIKSRSAAYDHVLIDAVRGVEKQIISNKTDAESQDAGKGLTSFDSDGFTVTLGTSTSYNNSSQTYAAWNWKAGGTGVSNTDGSITSTVSVGATSQQNWFSVVSYTGNGTAGATVGHGLNTQPSMIIAKNRDDGTKPWTIYHEGVHPTDPADYRLQFDTSGITNDNTVWNDTEPTSSVFTLGSTTWHNASGNDIIAYCFANAEGLCKVGKVTGNASADGPFIFTGFRPAMVLYKRSDSTGNWFIWDNQRDPYNTVLREIYPDQNAAEYTRSGSNDSLDLLSNGFKLRFSSAFTDRNASGGTYIYMAISEQPFKYANAR